LAGEVFAPLRVSLKIPQRVLLIASELLVCTINTGVFDARASINHSHLVRSITWLRDKEQIGANLNPCLRGIWTNLVSASVTIVSVIAWSLLSA